MISAISGKTMGRYYYYSSRKVTAEECLQVTVFDLKRWGLFQYGSQTTITWTYPETGKKRSVDLEVHVIDNPHVKFTYTLATITGESFNISDTMSLEKTGCYLGGFRYWFVCQYCWRRVAVLYLSPRNPHFACRHCNNLSYQSQNEGCASRLFSLEKKRDKLRSKTKTMFYNGRPTRNSQRLDKVSQKLGRCCQQTLVSINKRLGRYK